MLGLQACITPYILSVTQSHETNKQKIRLEVSLSPPPQWQISKINQFIGTGLSWLIVLEVSIHGWLVCCFSAYARQYSMADKSVYFKDVDKH